MNTRFKENVQKLFEYWCEISPTIGETVSGVIVESFPERFKDPEIITKIPEFAYPCEIVNESVQTYSFVLTSTDSKWRFGFCRHDAKSKTAMVIITYLPWHDIFLKFLNVLGELKQKAKDDFQPFLAEVYAKGVPEPGASLKLFYNSGLSSFIFQRPKQFELPNILKDHNLSLYYASVTPKNMIGVFAAMLAERRIIFTSRRLDPLSSSVQAAHAFLYPMVWQHIFIPILPLKMREILCAPMPYLIGVPGAVLETMTRDELGEVVVLNCDNQIFSSPFDDVKNMPAELVSQLKKQLSNQNEHHIGDHVSKIFLGVLVQLIGGYRDAIKFSQGSKLSWCREDFIESRPSHLRPFLRKMLELQIFQQFIEERLEMLNTGLGFSDEFELETLRHHEKMRRKPFLRNVKDKTNPAVKSAVQSVKQGGRSVKTACKDLKLKLSERAPSKGSSSSRSGSNVSASSAGYNKHHSAPNSPVFTNQPQNDLFSTKNSKTHRSKPAKMLETYNSIITNSNSTNHFNNNLTINNNGSKGNGDDTSTVAQNGNSIMKLNVERSKSNNSSPTSSLSSSSDMNILQELQQHALFKLPTVDRSLKPNNADQRRGSLLSTPDIVARKQSISEDAYWDSWNVSSSTTNSVCSNDTNSDVAPDVPPRILNPSSRSCEPIDPLIIIEDYHSDRPPIPKTRTKSKPHIPLNKHPNAMRLPMLEPKPKNLNSMNIQEHSGIIKAQTPIIELSPSNRKLNMTNNLHSSESASGQISDLIKLDESLSYDVNDFDPLNEHAKEIPPVPKRAPVVLSAAPLTMPRTSSNSNSPYQYPSVSNPMYTYHQPNQTMNKVKPSMKEDESELLRKYGLDRLNSTLNRATLNENSSNPFAINRNCNPNRTIDPFLDNSNNGLKTNGDIQPKSKNTWTTFD